MMSVAFVMKSWTVLKWQNVTTISTVFALGSGCMFKTSALCVMLIFYLRIDYCQSCSELQQLVKKELIRFIQEHRVKFSGQVCPFREILSSRRYHLALSQNKVKNLALKCHKVMLLTAYTPMFLHFSWF